MSGSRLFQSLLLKGHFLLLPHSDFYSRLNCSNILTTNLLVMVYNPDVTVDGSLLAVPGLPDVGCHEFTESELRYVQRVKTADPTFSV